jgi:hypothetical protein
MRRQRIELPSLLELTGSGGTNIGRIVQYISYWEEQTMKTLFAILIPAVIFLGLNYRQIYTAWTIRRETQRLIRAAAEAPVEFRNPAPQEDHFVSKLSTDFWKFSIINGAGQASHDHVWHAAEIDIEHGLSLHHFHDPDFENETQKLPNAPAAGQYNNVTLIGGSGFQPTASRDVVLQFSSKVSEHFYGTAGIIFQLAGTLQENGMFVKPFDMFGFAVAGRESSISGVNGPLCYLALNWVPAEVQPLSVDVQSLHSYEIRLRRLSQTEWLGSMRVDGTEQCQISVPAFGPVEVHVWSDNVLVEYRPRRWWEIAPSMDLKLQNGGEKHFQLGMIRLFEEAR